MYIYRSQNVYEPGIKMLQHYFCSKVSKKFKVYIY